MLTGEGTRTAEEDLQELFPLFRLFLRYLRGFPAGSAEFIDAMAAAGLGPRHLPVLMAIAVYGPQPVGVIARGIALSPATTSQLAGQLQRAGFVERRADERDRRRMIISIADARRAMVEDFAGRRLDPIRRALDRLSPQERAGLVKGWRLIIETLAETDEPGQPPPRRFFSD